MNINDIVKTAKLGFIKNSPSIMTGAGIAGVVLTAYLSGKASFKLSDDLREDPAVDNKDLIKKALPLYIPAGVSGIITVGCIFGANRVSSKRAAAAYSVLAISERAFDEYKEKVIEKLGENKERALKEEIAQERIDKSPPGNVIVSGQGSILCCELFTGRYFNSDMETLRKAQNDINAKLVTDLYVPLSEFYYIVGLPNTSNSWNIGWINERHMSLEFITVLSENNVPCLAFEYNYTKPV